MATYNLLIISKNFQNDKININVNQRILESSVPNSISAEPSRSTPDLTFIGESSITKRKLSEKDLPSTSAKRSNSEGGHVSVKNSIWYILYYCVYLQFKNFSVFDNFLSLFKTI